MYLVQNIIICGVSPIGISNYILKLNLVCFHLFLKAMDSFFNLLPSIFWVIKIRWYINAIQCSVKSRKDAMDFNFLWSLVSFHTLSFSLFFVPQMIDIHTLENRQSDDDLYGNWFKMK